MFGLVTYSRLKPFKRGIYFLLLFCCFCLFVVLCLFVVVDFSVCFCVCLCVCVGGGLGV